MNNNQFEYYKDDHYDYNEINSVRHRITKLIDITDNVETSLDYMSEYERWRYLNRELRELVVDYCIMLDSVYENINFEIWKNIDETVFEELDTKKECYTAGYLDGLKRAKWYLESFGESIPEINPHTRELFIQDVDELCDEGVGKIVKRWTDGIRHDSQWDKYMKDSITEYIEEVLKNPKIDISNPPNLTETTVELTPDIYKDYCSNCCISKDNT